MTAPAAWGKVFLLEKYKVGEWLAVVVVESAYLASMLTDKSSIFKVPERV